MNTKGLTSSAFSSLGIYSCRVSVTNSMMMIVVRKFFKTTKYYRRISKKADDVIIRRINNGTFYIKVYKDKSILSSYAVTFDNIVNLKKSAQKIVH